MSGSDPQNDTLARVLRALREGEHDIKLKALDWLARPAFADNGTVVAAVSGVLLRERGDYRAYLLRAAAARTLAAIGGPGARQPLEWALEDDHKAVQAAAIAALAALGDPAVLPALKTTLVDDSAEVRAAGLRAIAALAPADAAPYRDYVALLADRGEAVRDAASEALRAAGVAAVPALIAALQDDDSTVRGAAVELLAASGDERARDPLRKLATDDDSAWVKARADAALDALPKQTFVQPRVKRAAPTRDTLAQMRDDTPNWSRHGATADMTVEQIQAMLDSLDLRLMRGEISEALYQQLLARWQTRLHAVMHGGGADDDG